MYSILRIPASLVSEVFAALSGESAFQASALKCFAGTSGLFLGRFLPQIPWQINVVTAEDHAYDGTLIVASRFLRTPVFLSTGKVRGQTYPSVATLIPLSYCSE
jgi:hypothetical protein